MKDFTWNNRVVRRVYDRTIKGKRHREVMYEIHEAYYDRNKKVPHSITVDAIDACGSTLKGLRETLTRMHDATFLPVLDYNKIGGKRK